MQVTLTVAKGKSEGRQIPITIPVFLIGRSDDCHLRPKSDAISRRHCELSIDGEQVWVKDLGSKNGTIVNGQKISERVRINDGDTLRVGKLEFVLSVEKAAKSPGGDVADWLADDEDTDAKVADPDTRQLMLDETNQQKLKDAGANAEAAESADAKQTIDASDPQAEAETDAAKEDTTGFFLGRGKKKDKGDKEKDKKDKDTEAGTSDKDKKAKKPGKLPPRSGPKTESSTAAAAETLKKFFNNRG